MRKTKLVFLFLLVLSLALFTSGCDTLMPDPPPNDDPPDNGGETNPAYFEFESSTGTITGYNDSDGPSDVVIPSEINEVDVEVIGEGAFNALDFPIDSVEIPDTVTVIEPKAFRFNNLTTVDIPDGVEEIQNRAFRLNSLTEVKIADTVTFIGQYAFRNNDDLVLVEIGEGVNIEGTFNFADNFEEVYENNNKSAGVYKRDDKDSDWYKEE